MRLKCTNVGALGPGTVEFVFSDGLNAIIGRNGRGKSTVVNALYFAFTGETLNGLTLDSMVTWGCPDMVVELICDDFTIKRSVATSGTNKASFTRGDITITRKREIDAAICDMFGFVDKSVFRVVYFAEQLRALEVIETTNSGRVDMLSMLFGFARLEKIRAELQKQATALDVSEVGSDVINSLKETIARSLETIDRLSAEIKKNLVMVLSEDDVRLLNEKLNMPLVGTRDNLEQELVVAQFEYDQLYAELSTLPEPLSVDELSKLSMYNRYVDCKAESENLHNKLSELRSVEIMPSVKLQKFVENIDSLSVAARFKATELGKRKTLLNAGKCPLSGGSPCPDLASMTDSSKIDAELVELDSQLKAMVEDRYQIVSELERSKNHESEISKLESAVLYCDATLKSFIDMGLDSFDFDTIKARKDAIDQCAEQRSELEKSLASKSAAVESVKINLDNLKELTEITQEDKDAASDSLRKSVEAVASIKVLERSLADAEQALAEAKDSLSLAEAQNLSAEHNKYRRDLLNKARQVLHRDNLPRLLVNELLGVLNKNLNKFLNQFNFPFEVNWSSSGALTYKNEIGQDLDAKLLSGGQRYVLVVALRCAFASLFKAKFPLFVMDEPTTGLDVENREALSSVITAFAESRNMTTVIPTHDDMLLPESNIIKL